MEDERRVVLDRDPAPADVGQLRKVNLDGRTRRPGFGKRLGQLLLPALPVGLCERCFGVELVPALQYVVLGVFGHVLAIAADRPLRNLTSIGATKPVVATSDHEAGGQSLDVPLPRGRKGLVEVVDIEREVSLRRREPAEVHEMAIAARLHPYLRRGSAGEIGRHDGRRPPVEGERVLHHPSISNRNELGHPALARLDEQVDRVRAVRVRLPPRMGTSRDLLPQCLTSGSSISTADHGFNPLVCMAAPRSFEPDLHRDSA